MTETTLKGMYEAVYTIENYRPVLHLFCRDMQRKKTIIRVTDFKPYFYIAEDDTVGFQDVISYEPGFSAILDGKRLKRVYLKYPGATYEKRELAKEHFEADILFPIRYLIDKVDNIEKGDYHIAGIDIETTMKHGLPKFFNPIAEIFCITIRDGYTGHYHTFVQKAGFERKQTKRKDWTIYKYATERDMLTACFEHIIKLDYDIITAWNISFDMPYLLARARSIGINANILSPVNQAYVTDEGDAVIKGRVLFDLLSSYRKLRLSQLPSFSLNNVALAELGRKKLPVKNTDEVYEKNINMLLRYNKTDVELMTLIELKANIITQFDERRLLARLDNINSCHYFSRIIDTLMLRKYKRLNPFSVFPSKQPFRERTAAEHVGGGYVVDSKSGLYKWVGIVDMKRLYPSLILEFNLSRDTIVDNEKTANAIFINGYFFAQDKQGILPSILADLNNLRDKYDNLKNSFPVSDPRYSENFQKSASCKSLVNSAYGVCALTSFRLYDRRVADTITFLGREVNKHNEIIIDTEGHQVVLGDTDGLGFFMSSIDTKEQAATELNRIADIINKKLDDFCKRYGVTKKYLKLEPEMVYKKIIVGKKKRYAGWYVYRDGKYCDKYKYVGFEIRRSDSSEYSKRTQLAVLNLILHDADRPTITKYLYDQAMKLTTVTKYDDIATPTSLRKNITDYHANLPRCRSATFSNKHLAKNYAEGSKFFTLKIKHAKTDIIAFDENEDVKKFFKTEHAKIDWKEIMLKSIFRKMRTIFEAMRWDDSLDKLHREACAKLDGQKKLYEYKIETAKIDDEFDYGKIEEFETDEKILMRMINNEITA